MSISGGLVGSYSQVGKTFVIHDENGNEVTAVITGQEQIFTATDNDVREGLVYASDSGVSTGNKYIPGYETSAGKEIIFPGGSFSVVLVDKNRYDYTVFQCMISLADLSDLNNSVNTTMVSLNGGVFEVNSTNKLADISKNTETQSIDLNIVNTSEDDYIIHYFTYKET